ncbi:MAG: hypothetical protein ACREJF_02245, partial [Candidatus Methylomirabilales bacterium]
MGHGSSFPGVSGAYLASSPGSGPAPSIPIQAIPASIIRSTVPPPILSPGAIPIIPGPIIYNDVAVGAARLP